MNSSDQNHEFTPVDEIHDRLTDIALGEIVGGQAPPDLTSRILAADFATKPLAQSTYPRRFPWVRLAVAASLLIAVTMAIFIADSGQLRVSHRASGTKDRLGGEKRVNRVATNGSVVVKPEATSPADSTALSAGINEAQSANGSVPKEVADFDKLIDIIQSTVASEESVAEGKSSVSNLTLDISQTQSVDEGAAVPVTSGGTLSAGASPAVPEFKLDVSLPFRQHSFGAPADAPTAGKPYSYGAAPAPAPTTSQLVDEINELQQQGKKPSQQLLSQLARRTNKSVDLGMHGAQPETVYVHVSEGLVVPGLAPEGTVDGLTALVPEQKVPEGNIGPQGLINEQETAEGTGPDLSGDQYTRIVENPFIKAVGEAAVSTFSIDVDTASYSNVRQFLMEMNQLPPADAVRIEELVNYFDYDYAGPTPIAPGAAGGSNDDAPFAAHVEMTGCPWAPEHRLARIGIKGRELDRNKRPKSNLVFLVDVSGSMDEPNKLPLVVYGLEQLTRELGENDRVAIVVYASSEGLVLESTRGDKQDKILAALGKLQAGGSTAGGAGIQLAYQIAEDNFIKGGTNRVVLCTDGDFNVGVTSTAELERLCEKKAKDTGVFLSVLGFGRGNLNDAMMEAIADQGNGNYHYVDNRTEARRVLVEEMTGTLVTIAKDVKIQVEFNPALVAGYRLIGYENRMLRTEDFNDDKKDAGEIGAGHTVTALYEIVPAGKKVEVAPVDDLKYQKATTRDEADAADKVKSAVDSSKELLTLKMRYKAPDGDTSKKLEWAITDDGKEFSKSSPDCQFAAAVAGFGLLLRDSQYKGNLTFAATIELAQGSIGDDQHGYRKEFLEMVRRAKELRHE